MASEWAIFVERVTQLPVQEQRKFHDQFSSVLDGQHTVVSLKEPLKKKRIGRPTLKAQKKRRLAERAESSTQRDPSAFEVVEQMLEEGKKKRRRTKATRKPEDSWCFHCKEEGHLVEDCPSKPTRRSSRPRKSIRDTLGDQDSLLDPEDDHDEVEEPIESKGKERATPEKVSDLQCWLWT